VHKSLQAIFITLIVGMFLPNLFTLTGNAIADKLTWKISLSAIFALSTIVIGALYSLRLIKGRTAGGKSRIAVYLVLVIILCSFAMPFLVAFAQSIQWLIYLVGAIAGITIISLIIQLICKIISSKKQFKMTQQRSLKFNEIATKKLGIKNSTLQLNVINKKDFDASNLENKRDKFLINNVGINDTKYSSEISKTSEESEEKCFSLYQLWERRNLSNKCLTATNDENPDLDWVKIYKPPYKNGKFYGYVKMMNARDTVNGEIYFADHSIWREIK